MRDNASSVNAAAEVRPERMAAAACHSFAYSIPFIRPSINQLPSVCRETRSVGGSLVGGSLMVRSDSRELREFAGPKLHHTPIR